MEIISDGIVFNNNIQRLIKKYKNISFGVAWASANTDAFFLLIQNTSKIRNGTIGTHFYQTDPDVLDYFINSKIVKFIIKPEGIYHPKVYLFWDDDQNWEAIIGSANFTEAAMTKNEELNVLIGQEDGNYLSNLKKIIKSYFDQASHITEQEAISYRNIWNIKKKQLDRLVGNYGSKRTKKNAITSTVMSMDWSTFFKKITNNKTQGLESRIELLESFQEEFSKVKNFKDMNEQTRRAIAGIKSVAFPNWAHFGSMVGAGVYSNAIINNSIAISDALNEIPLTGLVTRDNYSAYVERYKTAFSNGRYGIATATRLLAMKRPDQFICVDNANLTMLAKDIGFIKHKLDYERYWDEIIERIMDTPWWIASPPLNKKERQVWKVRVALLDVIFYELRPYK